MGSSRRTRWQMRVEGALARGAGRLSDRTKLRLSGRPPVTLDGGTLDPGIQLTLRLAAARGGASFIPADTVDVAALRQRIRRDSAVIRGRPAAVGAVTEMAVPGPAGSLPARHYAPLPAWPDAHPAPLLVYLHGGGFVSGDLDTHDELCRLLCRHAACHVVAVDYRMAPEHPFPAALDDAIAAVRWALSDGAASFGADPARVAVGGDSAGGNLSAGVCQALAGADGPAITLQVLIYPVVDFAERAPSRDLFGEGFFLDSASMDWCESRYMGADADRADPRLSPLRGTLHGVAPAIVLTAAFDPLRDEGERYADALREAGVRVVAVRVPGMIHGFVNMTSINRAARDGVLGLAGMIRSELAPPRDRQADHAAQLAPPGPA